VTSVSDTRLTFAGSHIEFDNITSSAECENFPTSYKFAPPFVTLRHFNVYSRPCFLESYSLTRAMEPGTNLGIVVEANVTERKPHRPVIKIPFEFPFGDSAVRTQIKGYDIHEMLGKKLRALFQRRRGRDLFDLYWALSPAKPPVVPAKIIESFQHYLKLEGSFAGRAEFIALLDAHLADRGFCSDMNPLLRVGITYDPQQAGDYVKTKLPSLLPAH